MDFIREIIAEHNRAGTYGGKVVTRFPPEPNGYLHIGHAKSICLNFGIALENGAKGSCHLRFDDTNPETEDIEYVNSIMNDVKWLGFDWDEHLYFASDYFERMYDFAEELIRKNLAYVDSSSEEEIRELRGTVTEAGKPSSFRNRTIEENLDLFRRMRAGEFPDGAHVLRAKGDMSSANMLMRDPVFYRIRHASHYRTGDEWCIYPLYDYAHPIEDALECVTHSLCTLEFDNNREIYDWLVGNISVACTPRQYEFARLALDYTVMSKRKLLQLVNEQHVTGWDDPRMPTIAGLRRRGVTPDAIRNFCDLIGVAKSESRVDIAKLEYAIRDDLNQKTPRVLAVLHPVRVVITNYPEDKVELIDAPYYPRDVALEGTRELPFARTLYIDRDDFAETPPKGWHRLTPGAEVRLRYAYIIRCDDVVRDETGEIVELRCTYDPATHGGDAGNRSVKGTIQWLSAAHALDCEIRLYDRLFSVPDPDQGEDFKAFLNPDSLVVVKSAFVEPSIKEDPPGTRYQFERVGYFCSDMLESRPESLVYNRTVTLRDSWAKISGQKTEDEGRPRREKPRPRERESATAKAKPDITKPAELKKREAEYVNRYGLDAVDADLLTRDAATAEFFGAAADGGDARAIAKLMVNAGQRIWSDVLFSPKQLSSLVLLIERGIVSATVARQVLAQLFESGGDPNQIIEQQGLAQISDAGAIAPLVQEIVAANPDKAQAYRGGRTGLLGFFVGQVMSRTGGRANPELVKEIVEKQLA
ncbi:MAG: glutamine--tRNA ligase/YqeY domain fusion protein [Gemmatimonadota bacterium]